MFTHLYEILLHRARLYPNAVALGGQQGLGWRTLTSRALLAEVDALAAELAAEGVDEGDRVVLWAPNAPRTPIYLFALWRRGAIVVPFDREMNPEAAAEIIVSVAPRHVLVGYGERPVWTHDVAVTEWWEPGTRGQAGGTSAPPAPQTSDPDATPWQRPAEELAAIFFTSGTTGKPKGCMITHANLCFEVEALRHVVPLGPTSRLASILPLSHLYELTCGLLYPLASGAAIHFIPSRRAPDIVRVLREQRITDMIAVPQLLTMMGSTLEAQLREKLPAPVYATMSGLADRLPLPARRRLFFFVHRKLGGHLRMFGSGGAALPAETHRLWERLGVRVAQGYGASECAPVIASGSADGSAPIGSCGQPLPGVEVRLSPEGEALVRGPNVMRGYWQDPARTAEVLREGWYHTGDLAAIDERGNITLAGRAKDLIVLPSGMKVWPQDVEEVLRDHAAVKDAVVLAVPSAGGGATLHAYLLAGGPDVPDIAGIVAAGNARLAQHQRLATASWWPEQDFPRTNTLKVRRNLLPLPQNAEAVKIDSSRAADDPVGQAIAGAARVMSLRSEQTLAELGLDSLGLVELALALEEKTGKVVSDGDLRLEMTVEQARAFIAAAPALEEGAARGATGEAATSAEQPLWPYTWGRVFRRLSLPFDLLYRLTVTRTIVLGGEHLTDLPPRVILAGTHHSFTDVPLIRAGLRRTPAHRLAGRLVIAAQAGGFAGAGLFARYGILAFGLYPLRQYGDRDTSLRGLVRLMEAGNALLLFPQGIHALPEQERAGDPAVRFKPGVGHLARTLEAAVVPFGLAGTEVVMPAHLDDFKGPLIAGIPVALTRAPLAIAFGPPLTPAEEETPPAYRQPASPSPARPRPPSPAPDLRGYDADRRTRMMWTALRPAVTTPASRSAKAML